MKRRLALLWAALLLLVSPAFAQNNAMLDQALKSARQTFAQAAPDMGAVSLGVDNSLYADALLRNRFQSPSGQVDVGFVIEDRNGGECARFAAYVAPVADKSASYIFLCPKFFSPGADVLRETTILHELVHIVAGPDECRAMAYTAKLQSRATGAYQPVGRLLAAQRLRRLALQPAPLS